MRKHDPTRGRTRLLLAPATALMLCLASAGPLAADTDIATSPLVTSSSTAVKPNVMFTLDDSGSMASADMPDESSDSDRYGYWSSQCNGVAYDPNYTYILPVNSSGATLPAGSLVSGSPYYYKYTGSQTKLGWTYTTSGVVTSTDFYNECRSRIGNTPGSSVFTRVNVSATSGPAATPDERQNYANWYAYYRTRILLMKSAVSLAFKGIDDKFRVGFNTINNKTVSGSKFLDVADFTPAQKELFYQKLYATTTGNSTPLRGALSKIGQYFAKKAPSQSYDPVQYSCQKNFNILSTDGYWNTGDESSSYGPKMLDNSTSVGTQDSTAAFPYNDGVSNKVTTTETWSTTSTTVTVVETPTSSVSTSTDTTTTATPALGWSRKQYSAFARTVSRNNDDLTRCPSGTVGVCVIRVDTTSNHGFSTGDVITIAGVSESVFNGTFSITRVDSDTYSYQLPSRPSNSEGSNKGTSTRSVAGCPSGQGKLAYQEQRRDESTVSQAWSTITTTETSAIAKTTTTAVTAQPYTRTTVSVNGAAPTVTTVAGTPSSTSSAVNVTIPGTTTTGTSSGTTAGANVFSAWTSFGSVTYEGNCVTSASLPSPNPTNQVALGGPSTTTAVVTGPVTTTTGPTVTVGTPGAPVVTGPTLVESAHTSSTASTTTGTSSYDSLADVAMYYYETDLRTTSLGNCVGALGAGTDVCGNNVAPKGTDIASWQHMTTLTLGMGLNGTLKYDPKYAAQASGDYFDITQGTKKWPIPGDGKNAENIDDLWHAAVNGRGQYFSAGDPATLITSLTNALAEISEKIASASAAAASNLQPVPGDNTLFLAQYTSGKWVGDVLAKTIHPVTGVITDTPTWSAKQKLDAMVAAGTSRSIYYFKKDATGNSGQLRAFNTTNLGADSLMGHFDTVCSKSPALSQCATLTGADLTAANTGSNLVSWLRGGYHAAYRLRANILGDIIGGAPAYIGKPPFKYTDSGYAGFASAKAGRAGTVYVAANDGMLHAFDGASGEEKWAYMPSEVLPKLYRLADTNYAANHTYLVDGAPVIGEIYVPGSPGSWKTILVGGLGAGGRSYYALDITDPNNPVAMWEFSHANLGLAFGNPIITKRRDGTWVVMFGSGYNNNVTGDGNGHFFVLDANTGAQILTIPTYTSGTTAAGSTGTPSGLSKINVWVDSDMDNTAKRAYGGDLLGNVWRFDFDNLVEPHGQAMLLAQLVKGGVPQPITTKPALAEATQSSVKYPVVYVGTGKYLGTSDLSNSVKQTVYALKDPLTATGIGDARGGGTLVAQVMTDALEAGAKVRKITNNPVDWSLKNGWYVDLLSAGERVSVDPKVLFNYLIVAGNIPNADACTVGGESYLYKFAFDSGSSGTGADGGIVGEWLGNTLVVGFGAVQGQAAGSHVAGSGDTFISVVDSGSGLTSRKNKRGGGGMGNPKRTSWREIVN